MWTVKTPPVINMGGLIQFEKKLRVSAPVLIDRVVRFGAERPDRPLPDPMLALLAELIAACMGGGRKARRRAQRLLTRYPDRAARALRDFLDDPLPTKVGKPSKGDRLDIELPSVLDMRTAWIAGGGNLYVFDRLTLWEHARLVREQEKLRKAALADAAIAARISQIQPQQFKKFIAELLDDGRAKTARDWAAHMFRSTSHMPKITQEQLAAMKGRA